MAGQAGSRPLGVTVIAVLALIAGLLGALASLTVFGLGGGVAAFSGTVTLVVAVVLLVMAYGLWMLRSWSWRLAAVMAVVNFLWELARFLFRGADPLNLLVAVVFGAIWIYYLNLTSVRSALGAPASGFPVVGHALDSILGTRP